MATTPNALDTLAKEAARALYRRCLVRMVSSPLSLSLIIRFSPFIYSFRLSFIRSVCRSFRSSFICPVCRSFRSSFTCPVCPSFSLQLFLSLLKKKQDQRRLSPHRGAATMPLHHDHDDYDDDARRRKQRRKRRRRSRRRRRRRRRRAREGRGRQRQRRRRRFSIFGALYGVVVLGAIVLLRLFDRWCR